MYLLLSSAMAGFLAPALPAADEEPTGLAPTLRFVRIEDKGRFEYLITVTKYVPVARQVEVVVNGLKQVRNITEAVPVTHVEKHLLDPKGVDVYDLDGTKTDESVWQNTLKKGAVVALSEDGKLPHAAYRKALKASTLVLVVKLKSILPAPSPVKQ
jgi:hypothetical protein